MLKAFAELLLLELIRKPALDNQRQEDFKSKRRQTPAVCERLVYEALVSIALGFGAVTCGLTGSRSLIRFSERLELFTIRGDTCDSPAPLGAIGNRPARPAGRGRDSGCCVP